MTIRQCPDCKGRGRFWRPPRARIGLSYFVAQPEISITAGYWYEERLPEWYDCDLCGGKGRVMCEKVKEAADA